MSTAEAAVKSILLQPKNLAFGLTALVGTLLDQGTKGWIIANVAYRTGEIDLIDGWLSLVHERNDGAAFSTFEGWQGLFIAFTLVALAVLFDQQRRLKSDAVFMATTLGLILSGALGNFIDRLRFAYVTDFIRVYTEWPPLRDWLEARFNTNTYPIFNVADAAILVGVVLFLLYSTFNAEEDVETPPAAPAEGAQA